MFGSFGQPSNTTTTTTSTSTPSLFGNTNPGGTTTSTSAPSLFGNTQQQGTGGGNLFGQPAGQMGGGLFGQPGGQTGGGLFSQPTGQQQQQQSGAGTTGTGLFGQTGTAGSTGTSLFGQPAGQTTSTGTTGTSLFGQPANPTATAGTGTSLFGQPAGQAAIGATGQGTSLFGQPAGQTSTTGTGGSLFGGQMSNMGGAGSLFGAPRPAGTTGTGLFGQPATGTGMGLFGQPATGTAGAMGTSLFGQPAQQQQQPQQQQLQQQGSSLFGSTLGGSTLGGGGLGSSLLSSSALFPNSSLGNTNNAGGGLFSSRAMVGAPTSSVSGVGGQQQDAMSQFRALLSRIESVKNGWDSKSPQCRFQHYFYNLVDPAQVHLYGRPANAMNEELWQKAVRENPDPKCLVPVLAVGMDDLQQRVEAQTRQANEQQERLKELETRIGALHQRHLITTSPRLHRAALLQTQLTQRLLGLLQHLHLLIPALRSSSIRPEEEALRAALEEIEQDVRRPGSGGGVGVGRLRARVNELWALVGAVNAARERDRRDGGVEWAVVDEDGLAQIAQVLAEEQAGLAHVTKILQQDVGDLSVICGEKRESEDVLMASAAGSLGGSVMIG